MKFTLRSAFLFLLIANYGAAFCQLAPNEPKNVAIFLYQDVELLDFAGPGEVFSASGYKTYTVSVDGKELTSQGFVKIQPEYSIDNAPIPDIIVFPGGNSTPSANDATVINWVKSSNSRGTNFLTVCTGAFIVAKAGLLENKRATTHWGSTRGLAKNYPTTTVMEDTRWVDNGFLITTAGVSAGIDGALHFVARINGLEAAQRTARYMEYNKWNPDNGVVDVKNEFLENVSKSTGKSNASTNVKAPFVGEFVNYANAAIAKGDFASAKKIAEEGIKVYPNADDLFNSLGIAKRKIGEPAPIGNAELIAMIREGKVDDAIARYHKDKKTFPNWRIFQESAMNDAGYFLLTEKKDIGSALKVFELNTSVYPQSPNTFDSYGEVLLLAGNKKEGIENYMKAAAMGYENAKKVLKNLEAQ